ncbi:DUF4440 domain-containing protein [Vibrio sp. HN007]|uniref:nuclear transport factor 2 family protein n=1 Tax=Vibrio iocasae TaxID=3098914 RepID=UPI0035D3FBCF
MDILIQQEKALHQFEVRKNKQEVARLLSPDFYEVGKSGESFDYPMIVEMMAAEEPSTGHIHSQGYNAIELEQSVYLLLYNTAWIDDAGNVSLFSKRSSIWVNNEAGWQMRYHQGTPCKPFVLTKEKDY